MCSVVELVTLKILTTHPNFEGDSNLRLCQFVPSTGVWVKRRKAQGARQDNTPSSPFYPSHPQAVNHHHDDPVCSIWDISQIKALDASPDMSVVLVQRASYCLICILTTRLYLIQNFFKLCLLAAAHHQRYIRYLKKRPDGYCRLCKEIHLQINYRNLQDRLSFAQIVILRNGFNVVNPTFINFSKDLW